jgi:hypothetical protein
LAKPEEIKAHQEGQEGNQEEKKETPEPISFQERMEAQIARPDLKGKASNDSTAKEETIFQDQKEPPPVIGLAPSAEPHSPLWADFLPVGRPNLNFIRHSLALTRLRSRRHIFKSLWLF